MFISQVFSFEDLGFEEMDEEIFRIYFREIELGELVVERHGLGQCSCCDDLKGRRVEVAAREETRCGVGARNQQPVCRRLVRSCRQPALREDHTSRLMNYTQLSDILSKQQDHPLHKTPAPFFDVRSTHSSPSQRSLYSLDTPQGILVEDFSF